MVCLSAVAAARLTDVRLVSLYPLRQRLLAVPCSNAVPIFAHGTITYAHMAAYLPADPHVCAHMRAHIHSHTCTHKHTGARPSIHTSAVSVTSPASLTSPAEPTHAQLLCAHSPTRAHHFYLSVRPRVHMGARHPRARKHTYVLKCMRVHTHTHMESDDRNSICTHSSCARSEHG